MISRNEPMGTVERTPQESGLYEECSQGWCGHPRGYPSVEFSSSAYRRNLGKTSGLRCQQTKAGR